MSAASRKTQRPTLRNEIRQRRRRVDDDSRINCAQQLALHTYREPLVRNSQHIATYLPADGEIDTRPLMDRLWSLGKTLYLPVLTPFTSQRLWFSSYAPGDTLVYNRYGILEPERTHYRRIKAMALDLVLMPLVAFDDRGHRLGMGGGFYDYSFSFIKLRQYWRKPHLLGLAYEFQRTPNIDAAPWDVPMDAVATEQGVYHYRQAPLNAYI